MLLATTVNLALKRRLFQSLERNVQTRNMGIEKADFKMLKIWI